MSRHTHRPLHGYQPMFHRGVWRAAAKPTPLALGGCLAAAALIFGSWWLLLCGAVAWALSVGALLSQQSFWRALVTEEYRLVPLAPGGIRDPSLQVLVDAFTAGRIHVEQVLSDTPQEVKEQLCGTLKALDSLESCATRLALHAQALTDMVLATSRNSMKEELTQLGHMAQNTTDAEMAQDYACVLCWHQEQLRVIDEISAARERAVSTLLRAIVMVKGLPARIVGLRMLSTQVDDTLSSDLRLIWEEISGNLQSSEQVLHEVRALGPS